VGVGQRTRDGRPGMTFGRHGVRSVALAFALAARALLACSGSPSASASGGKSVDAAVGESDAGSPSDAGPHVPLDAASSCSPANVQGYVPKWTPPKAPASACTPADLTSYAACLDSSSLTPTACAPWTTTATDAGPSAACKTCVADSKASDPAWGPVVDLGTSGSERQLNISGCLAIVLHDTGGGCSGTYQARQGCESAACADNCEGASSSSLVNCVAASDLGGCSNYVAPSACAFEAGASAEACFGPDEGTFGEKFAAIGAVFCLETDGGK
jgi:hypothetical protein